MATQNNQTRSFPVNAAMSAYRVVAVSSNGSIGLAAVDVRGVGILQEDTTANSYERPCVRLYGTGTFRVAVTGTPLTAGNAMVVVTNGQVSVTNGLVGNTGVVIGILLESAALGTNGSIREVSFGAGA
jgi:hypothetical protein